MAPHFVTIFQSTKKELLKNFPDVRAPGKVFFQISDRVKGLVCALHMHQRASARVKVKRAYGARVILPTRIVRGSDITQPANSRV
jgi:hypothetical protein